MKLSIKNMVCPRCITAVSNVLDEMHLQPTSVTLGEAEIAMEPEETQMLQLKDKLHMLGFELLEDSRSRLADRIKSIVIAKIQEAAGDTVTFSELLASELNRDYSGISKLFSAEEGLTIEQFIIFQKTEKAKELLLYNEMTLGEIADALGYSSSAHLSAQFKKASGMTPTAFRKEGVLQRNPLDAVSKTI